MRNTDRFFAIFCLFVLSSTMALGQRFHKTYPQVGDDFVPYRGVEEVGGYSIGLVRNNAPSSLRDMHLDADGHLVSLTDIPVAYDLSQTKFIRTSDGGFLFYTTTSDSTLVERMDIGGQRLWIRSLPFVSNLFDQGGLAVVAQPDGFYFVGTYAELDSVGIEHRNFLAAKIGLDGTLGWLTISTNTEWGADVKAVIVSGAQLYFQWCVPIADPGFTSIGKISAAGTWSGQYHVNGGWFNSINDFFPDAFGGFVQIGYKYDFWQTDPFGQGVAFDSTGQVAWSRPSGWPQLNTLCDFNFGGAYYPQKIAAINNGWVMAGSIRTSALQPTYLIFLAKLDSLGNITALRTYPHTNGQNIRSLTTTSDGGCLLTYAQMLNNQQTVTVLKTDSNLIASPNLIIGNIFQDQNLTCQRDSNEMGMSNWFVQVIHELDSVYTTTNAQGQFSIEADAGAYLLKIKSFNPYWEPCSDTISVHFLGENETKNADFALQSIIDCPQMEVFVALPRIRRCLNNPLYVRYCNNGTATATNGLIRLMLAPELDFVSSGIPLLGQSGDTLFFDIGSVGVNECGNFSLLVNANCDETTLGQTLCVEAQITPDTFCVDWPNWSGARIEATGVCGLDSVIFILKNTGNAPSQTLDFIVIEDIVVWREDSFQLNPGEADTIRAPINGSTWRIEAEQEPGFPLPGKPTAWVEACGWDGSLPFSGGFVTQFPDEDGNPAAATDCRVIIGSYDPNEKQASPEGADEEHYILPGTPIEYLVRFQNTGTDTAINVVVQDRLSVFLEPMSTQLGAASHACHMELGNDNTLKFIFDEILLPDSNANMAASQGFVYFRARPRVGIPLGTRIENTAAIYFDFNQPIHTNTTWHTVDTAFLKKTTDHLNTPISTLLETKINPNPAQAGEWMYLPENPAFLGNNTMRITDCTGKYMATLPITAGKVRLPKKLAVGVYFWEINQAIHGKFVVL